MVAATANVGDFVEFKNDGPKHYAILVDDREGDNKGAVLEHPLFDEILKDRPRDYSGNLTRCVVDIESVPDKESLESEQCCPTIPIRGSSGADPTGKA